MRAAVDQDDEGGLDAGWIPPWSMIGTMKKNSVTVPEAGQQRRGKFEFRELRIGRRVVERGESRSRAVADPGDRRPGPVRGNVDEGVAVAGHTDLVHPWLLSQP